MYRQSIKRLVRPLTVRVVARIDARIDRAVRRVEVRLDDAERSLRQLADDVDAFKSYVPTMLNTLSSQNAAARGARRAENRIEERLAAIDARFDEVGATLERLQAAVAGNGIRAAAPHAGDQDEVPA